MMILWIFLEACALFLFATLVFDVLHYFLHLCLRSSNRFIHRLGKPHLAHHRFFNNQLQINPEYQRENLYSHVMLENGIQLAVIVLSLAWVNPVSVMLAAIFQGFLFMLVYYRRGKDAHHKPRTQLARCSGGIYVTSTYHALHHVHGHQYYGSWLKIIDYLLGTAHHLSHKRIVMTGSNGALGSHMKILLEKEHAIVTTLKYGVDFTYDNYDKCIPALREADILFLCHGSKYKYARKANCDSYVKLIELYRKVKARDLLPLEIWATGSEIECHPCFGIKKLHPYAKSKRNYARYARKLYHDNTLQYRHLVHSAFTSGMGRGLISAKWAAFLTLFFLKRGFRYIPVSYTGVAYFNYLRFLWPFTSSAK